MHAYLVHLSVTPFTHYPPTQSTFHKFEMNLMQHDNTENTLKWYLDIPVIYRMINDAFAC